MYLASYHCGAVHLCIIPKYICNHTNEKISIILRLGDDHCNSIYMYMYVLVMLEGPAHLLHTVPLYAL